MAQVALVVEALDIFDLARVAFVGPNKELDGTLVFLRPVDGQ